MNTSLIVIGAGGHAAVVADALLSAGAHVLGFTDVDARRHGQTLCGLPILGNDSVLDLHAPAALCLINGIGSTGEAGNQGARKAVQRRLEAKGWRFAPVRHPSAVVSRFALLSADAQLLATSVVQAGARVGEGCIVNTGAIVEHGTQLGEFVHVACGAVLCGNVHVGAHSHVGAGAVIRQGVRLGDDTVVGAGAVVVGSFEGGRTLIGVPASARRNGS